MGSGSASRALRVPSCVPQAWSWPALDTGDTQGTIRQALATGVLRLEGDRPHGMNYPRWVVTSHRIKCHLLPNRLQVGEGPGR